LRPKTPRAKKPAVRQSRASDQPRTKPWTLLVYMVTDSAKAPAPGGSPLDTTAQDDAFLMLKGLRRHSRTLHVAIQADLKATPGVYRWILGRGQDFRRESLATTTRVLNDFFEWGQRECPAERYAVLFWGHSAGPMGLFSDGVPGSLGSGDELSLKELSAGLRHMSRKVLNRQPIDIVLFKNCFQAILETGFEVRDSVRYVIASQALIPAAGWPYSPLLGCLTQEPTGTIVRKLLNALDRFYSKEANRGGHPEVPFSLLDPQALEGVVLPLQALVSALVKANDQSANIRAACLKAWVRNDASPAKLVASENQFIQRLTPGDVLLVDMRTLCSELTRLGVPVFSRLAETLGPKIDRLVLESRPKGSQFHGVSAYYVPAARKSRRKSFIGALLSRSAYEELVCSRKTHWDKIALENSA
jgi:hypothetical protein